MSQPSPGIWALLKIEDMGENEKSKQSPTTARLLIQMRCTLFLRSIDRQLEPRILFNAFQLQLQLKLWPTRLQLLINWENGHRATGGSRR